jgi:hypothetical protein
MAKIDIDSLDEAALIELHGSGPMCRAPAS